MWYKVSISAAFSSLFWKYDIDIILNHAGNPVARIIRELSWLTEEGKIVRVKKCSRGESEGFNWKEEKNKFIEGN